VLKGENLSTQEYSTQSVEGKCGKYLYIIAPWRSITDEMLKQRSFKNTSHKEHLLFVKSLKWRKMRNKAGFKRKKCQEIQDSGAALFTPPIIP
jgi:hypothetical protein